MVWRNGKERPKRYLISVGRDRLREKILSEMWQICEMEDSTMADEIWDALYMHVERHRELLDKYEPVEIEEEPTADAGDGSGLMDKEPQPDFSMPEGGNIFDKIVGDMVAEASAEEVEEVLDVERRESRIVDSRNMYGRKESA